MSEIFKDGVPYKRTPITERKAYLSVTGVKVPIYDCYGVRLQKGDRVQDTVTGKVFVIAGTMSQASASKCERLY